MKRPLAAMCLVVGVCVLATSAAARPTEPGSDNAGGNGKGLALGLAKGDGPASILAHALKVERSPGSAQSNAGGNGNGLALGLAKGDGSAAALAHAKKADPVVGAAHGNGGGASGGGNGNGGGGSNGGSANAASAPAGPTSASAGNGDFNYVVNPPNIKGPALNSLSGPMLPGLGNDCTPLFGTPFTVSCYDPTQIRNAYDVPSDLTGAGQTIIIVDAYGDPTIEQDLAAFDFVFGLPDPPSFTIYHGSATQKAGPHDAAGWAIETALDVEWAHAIAPGANIVLAEAHSSSGNAINVTERQVVAKYPGAIVSQSFGINENAIAGLGNNIQVKQAHANYEAFAAAGDTVLASAGDEGATTGTSSNTPSFPSSDPNVVSVGGTQGAPYPLGLCPSSTSDACSYGGEAVWNEPSFEVATGGAPSEIFSAPTYQSGLTGYDMRTTPDVAYNAAINGGVLVFQGPYIYLVGGTSCGSPQWAGIFALVNEARASNNLGPIGAANPALYSIYQSSSYSSDFHDITTGDNTLVGAPVDGYPAKSGYDLATGIGTPDVANLVDSLSSFSP